MPLAQRLIAPNDTHGNPCRLVALYSNRGRMTCYAEGYQGMRGILLELGLEPDVLPEVNIGGQEYRRLLRTYGATVE